MIILSEKDFNRLLEIMEEDREPSPALVKAFKCYEAMFGKDSPKNDKKLEKAETFRRKQMDTKSVKDVKDAVDAKISQGEMFTAYDITKVLRKTGWAKHFAVRDEVHRIFMAGEMDDADYKRTNGRVTSNDDYAWIYHHYMDDADDYINPSVSPANTLSPTNVTPAGPVASVSVPASVAFTLKTPASSVSGNFYYKAVDSRGRLLIEKSYVAGLGLSPGDDAYVYTSLGKLIIVNGSYTGTLLRVYLVDKDGAVRIGSKICNYTSSSPVKRVTPGPNAIVVE